MDNNNLQEEAVLDEGRRLHNVLNFQDLVLEEDKKDKKKKELRFLGSYCTNLSQKAADGKELLGRRLKNWKMDLDDETMAAILKKLQYKTPEQKEEEYALKDAGL